MDNSQVEQCIIRNILILTKKTLNVGLLSEKLVESGILNEEDEARINSPIDEEGKCNVLYETLLRKQMGMGFTKVVDALRETNNAELGRLLMDSATPEAKPRRLKKQSSLTKRVSCSDFYEDVVGKKPVSGREMGIAEILEENETISSDEGLLGRILEVDGEVFSEVFVVQTTLLLRDWVKVHKREGNLDKLTMALIKNKQLGCAGRIRKMFEKSDAFHAKWESCDDNSIPVSVLGKERDIAAILNDNPSFSLHVDRLLLLLDIPLELFKVYLGNSKFTANATAILKVWKSLNEQNGTIQNLATLLAQNGHCWTAEKIRQLSATTTSTGRLHLKFV